jgi:hypothetical protein
MPSKLYPHHGVPHQHHALACLPGCINHQPAHLQQQQQRQQQQQ